MYGSWVGGGEANRSLQTPHAIMQHGGWRRGRYGLVAKNYIPSIIVCGMPVARLHYTQFRGATGRVVNCPAVDPNSRAVAAILPPLTSAVNDPVKSSRTALGNNS